MGTKVLEVVESFIFSLSLSVSIIHSFFILLLGPFKAQHFKTRGSVNISASAREGTCRLSWLQDLRLNGATLEHPGGRTLGDNRVQVRPIGSVFVLNPKR